MINNMVKHRLFFKYKPTMSPYNLLKLINIAIGINK